MTGFMGNLAGKLKARMGMKNQLQASFPAPRERDGAVTNESARVMANQLASPSVPAFASGMAGGMLGTTGIKVDPRDTIRKAFKSRLGFRSPTGAGNRGKMGGGMF